MSAMEKAVRELAYELWEQAGRPDGRSDEFWFAARAELESGAPAAEKREADAPVPPPKASPAPAAAKRSAAARPGVKPKTKRT